MRKLNNAHTAVNIIVTITDIINKGVIKIEPVSV